MPNRYQDIVENLECVFDFLPPGSYPEPIPDEQLSIIEVELDHRLPADYREFLRDYGGCGLSGVHFPIVKDSEYETEASVFFFYSGISEGSDIVGGYRLSLESDSIFPINEYPGLSLVRDVEDRNEEIAWPKELLAIACDMGGNQICLALSGLRPGAIFQWMNAPGDGQNIYLIAQSFDEFMRLLRKAAD